MSDQMRMPKTFGHLDTDRSIGKFILLDLLTSGVYGLVIMTILSIDINTIARPHDGKKTMNYCLMMFLVAPLTLGIGAFVWYHNLSKRMQDELGRRNITPAFKLSWFWHWCVLWGVIIALPLVASIAFLVMEVISWGTTGYAGMILPLGILTAVLMCLVPIGRYVYLHKLFKAMNALAADFNLEENT